MATNMTWFRLNPAELLVELLDCTPKEWYLRSKKIAKALAKRERGIDEWADRMMDDAESYSEQRKNAGRASADARRASSTKAQRKASETPTETQRKPDETPTETQRNANEVRNPVSRVITDRTDRTDSNTPIDTLALASREETAGPSTVGPSTVGPSGKTPVEDHRRKKGVTPVFDGGAFAEDPYGYIATIPNMSLPDFATWFCCEPDNDKAKRRYGAFCKERGSARFRSLLVSFVGEVNAGEEPDNRGAAFTRRVMEAWRP